MNVLSERYNHERRSGFHRAMRLKKCAAVCIAQELQPQTPPNTDYPENGIVVVEAPSFSNPGEQLVVANWLQHHPESAIVFINRALSGAGATEDPTEFVSALSYVPEEKIVSLHLSEEKYT